MTKPLSQIEQLERDNARQSGAIADALAAMDEGRYGDARRILKTGRDNPLISRTSVIAKDATA